MAQASSRGEEMVRSVSAGALAESAPARPRTRNLAMLFFVALSLLVSMSISQEQTPEIGSWSYWLLVIPAGLLPLADAGALFKTLLGRARLLLLFGVIAGAWHLLRGDTRAVLQLGLIVWVLAWVSTDRAHLKVQDLLVVYLTLVAIGVGIWMLTDLNKWGPIPGTTVDDYGVWRVSFFPNIANTAMLSLAVLLVLSRSIATVRAHALVFGIALYFLLFSFVRTTLIALAVYLVLRWWFGRRQRSARLLFWTSLLVGIGINVMIASSVVVIDYLQQFQLVSRLMLRSETGLTPEEIYQQLYRPWLWWQHLTLFATSPSLMGLGVFEFVNLQTEELNVGTTPAGNEALLTRLLASYGLPAFLFMFYLISRLRHAARQHDLWACACFPALMLLIMQWGAIFHPTDALGTIFFLMMVHGSKAFTGARAERFRV